MRLLIDFYGPGMMASHENVKITYKFTESPVQLDISGKTSVHNATCTILNWLEKMFRQSICKDTFNSSEVIHLCILTRQHNLY
jgi:hypothetical protein